jgi:hypothetical protein
MSRIWRRFFRGTRFSAWLLGIIIASLAVRTVSYNYDLALSAKDNGHNWNPLYKPLKPLPIKTKKPRALSSITVHRAQTHNDIRKDAPFVKFVPVQEAAIARCAAPTPQETSLRLSYFNIEPPDLCVRNAVFRI